MALHNVTIPPLRRIMSQYVTSRSAMAAETIALTLVKNLHSEGIEALQ